MALGYDFGPMPTERISLLSSRGMPVTVDRRRCVSMVGAVSVMYCGSDAMSISLDLTERRRE